MNSSVLNPMPIARRSAIFSGVYPPTTGSSMLKYVHQVFGRSSSSCWMPLAASAGLSLPLASG